MNEIDNTVERIGQLPSGAWVILPTMQPRQTIHAFDLKALANAYTKAVADNEKLRACAEHYADDRNWGYCETNGHDARHYEADFVDDAKNPERMSHGYELAEQTLDAIKPKDVETGEQNGNN